MSTHKDYGSPIRIYDNGGRTLDRYTAIAPRWGKSYQERGFWNCVSFDYRAAGFAMWVSAAPGPHLGKRVHIDTLSPEARAFVAASYPEYFPNGN